MRYFLLVAVLLICTGVLNAATINVPTDQPTIQAGIDATLNGDTVLVADGTYPELIDFGGKAIVVASQHLLDSLESHISGTIIQPLDSGSVVSFINGEDSSSVLHGFTITGGSGTWSNTINTEGYYGGGIFCISSNPIIEYCSIVDNNADYGGGLCVYNGSPTIRNDSIARNTAINGGGLWTQVDISLKDCQMADNAGGVWSLSENDRISTHIVNFNHCTVQNNQYAIRSDFYTEVVITNGSIITNNGISAPFRCKMTITDSKIQDCSMYSGGEMGVSVLLRNDTLLGVNFMFGEVAAANIINCTAYDTDLITHMAFCYIDSSLFHGSISHSGGNPSRLTVVRSDIRLTESFDITSYYLVTYEESIIVTDGIPAFIRSGGLPRTLTLSNCDVFELDSVPWITDSTAILDTSNVMFLDPLFCEPDAGDYTLYDISPCLPENNACSVLIGAFGVGCYNVVPEITSPNSIHTLEDSALIYQVTFVDDDGPDTLISYINLPAWLSTDADSVFGTPDYGDGDTNFTIIVSDGYFADTLSVLVTVQPTTPEMIGVYVEGEVNNEHILSHTPLIEWSYTDPLEQKAQTQVEIAVGTDNDWEYAEMWNPAPFVTSDTFITYAGIELLDGETYYLRLRVHNSVAWSDWYETSFRMNSVPSMPVPLSPLDDEQTDNQPVLWVQNSTDAESDLLTYDFFCCVDTTYGEPDPIDGYDIVEGTDSTGWQVSESLDENKRYWWSARSYDGYEYSDWTDLFESAFFVDGSPEAPTAPQALYPPDTGNMPVFNMLPTFTWSESTDPDPLDSVRYKLEVSINSGFTFVQTIDSLMTNAHTMADSLTFSTQYWWRVTAFDNTGLSTMSPNTPDFWTWTLGDLDHTHTVDISDLVMLVDYMFNGGAAPYPLFVADFDGSCLVDISDLVYLVDYMFLGGPAPLVGCE